MNIVKLCPNIVNHTAKPIVTTVKPITETAGRAIETTVAPKTAGFLSRAANTVATKFNTILTKIKEASPTVSTVSDTIGAVKENISRARETGNKGRIKSIYTGIKDSKGALKEGVKEISGVNDVRIASKEKGTTGAITEGGKAALKVALSGVLTVAGTVSPIPGAGLIGLFAGEKIAEAITGKPISKKLPKVK